MPKTFVYTELQISLPIADAPWTDINDAIKTHPGFNNKTWLQGYGTNSLGDLYEFDDLESAQKFVTGYFPGEATNFGVAQMTRIFDGTVTADASRDINSVHYDTVSSQAPGAFVYTELQTSVPFDKFPWQDRNTKLKTAPGLIGKTWLSAHNTHTLGGFDAFDNVENTQEFALHSFPKVAASLNSAFITRVFDASITVEMSRDMRSPFYT